MYKNISTQKILRFWLTFFIKRLVVIIYYIIFVV
nr:MAG TPA: hypothetical protein [Caudoviricetes sp.]